nr:MAG TPA: hypothetical protein [Caudoviricetes sp.]
MKKEANRLPHDVKRPSEIVYPVLISPSSILSALGCSTYTRILSPSSAISQRSSILVGAFMLFPLLNLSMPYYMPIWILMQYPQCQILSDINKLCK